MHSDNEPNEANVNDDLTLTKSAISPNGVDSKIAKNFGLDNSENSVNNSDAGKLFNTINGILGGSNGNLEPEHVFQTLKRSILKDPRFPYLKNSDGVEERLSKNAETELLSHIADFIIRRNCDHDSWWRLVVDGYRFEIGKLRSKAGGPKEPKKHLSQIVDVSGPSNVSEEIKFNYYMAKYLSGENLEWSFVTAKQKKIFLVIVEELLKLQNSGDTGIKLTPELEKDVVIRTGERYVRQVSCGAWPSSSSAAIISDVVKGFYMQALIDLFEKHNGEIFHGEGFDWQWKSCELLKKAIAHSEK
ncbi:hypothetical protein RUND412_000984 [Rhizina undulata]